MGEWVSGWVGGGEAHDLKGMHPAIRYAYAFVGGVRGFRGGGDGLFCVGVFSFPHFSLDVWGNIDFGGFSFLRKFFFTFLTFEKGEGD